MKIALQTIVRLAACLLVAPWALAAQERGAAALGHALDGLAVNTRVLMIGAHPDDEDTQLLSFLARGRHVETAYLSLTRGDGGQNLIGNELGEALGIIRTEELLAARQVDGAHQYFTRAYDFGFSKSAEETFQHWPHDSVLRDVVTIIRAFRPHVVVAVFSGTPRDGHGHHQVSGILAREAYDAAGDSVRFPAAVSGGLPPWTPLKLYQTLRGNAAGATAGYNVGEYDPLLGRSYGEVAGESRSQHRSQGFGALEPRGVRMTYVRLERSRVGGVPEREGSMFDGIDTTWNRFRSLMLDAGVIDSVLANIAAARAAYDPFNPEGVIAPLGRARTFLQRFCMRGPSNPPECAIDPRAQTRLLDLWSSLSTISPGVGRAIALASGVSVEAAAPAEVLAVGEEVPITLTLYNRGKMPIAILSHEVTIGGVVSSPGNRAPAGGTGTLVLPDSSFRSTVSVKIAAERTAPWWLQVPKAGDMFAVPLLSNDRRVFWGRGILAEDMRDPPGFATVAFEVGGTLSGVEVPLTYRYADRVLGEVELPAAVSPLFSVTLDGDLEVARANAPYDRTVEVRLVSGASDARDVNVSLKLPAGLSADSIRRAVRLPAGGTALVAFRVRGTLPPGRHQINATAESMGESYSEGYTLIDYPHIRRQRQYRPASMTLHAADVVIPPALRVAYIPGVGDNVAPVLERMGVPITVVPATAVATTDFSIYTTVVIGPRAYDANPDLAANNPKLFEFARRGGTLLVQYGQNMDRPGVMPYPIGRTTNQDRVTEEDSPVRILDAGAPILNSPNRITTADFAGWVQERATYMPRTRDGAYTALLAMNDSGEQPLDGGLLVARMGDGAYVYCTLALFRQLPAGVPGAARLMVNLMSAGLR